jgi:hypothetical protein
MFTLTVASDGRPAGLDHGRKVSVWRDDAGDVFATLFAGDARRWVDWPEVGVFVLSPETATVTVWLAPGADEETATAVFVRAIHGAALQSTPGWQLLHASAALVDEGALVFCGRSGAGKSTLAYAFGRAGFMQLADDRVAIEIGDDVRAAGLPFRARLRRASADHFSGYGSPASQALPARAPIRACFLLSQDPDCFSPRIARVPPNEAFARLLSHAHCFDAADPAETRRLTDDYLTIARTVPVFDAAYAPGFRQIGSLIDALTIASRRAEPASRAALVSQ